LLSPVDRRPYQRRNIIQPQERIELWQQLLNSYKDSNFRATFPVESQQAQGEIFFTLGFIYLFEMGQLNKALEAYEQGLHIARSVESFVSESRVLTWKKAVHWALEEYQEVLKSSEQHLEITEAAIEKIENGNYLELDPSLSDLSLTEEEEEYLLEHLLGELTKQKGRIIYDMGTAYLALGQPQNAIRFYEQSSSISEDCFCFSIERGSVPLNLGIAYWLSGQYEQAAEVYAQIKSDGVAYSPLDYPVILAGRAYEHLAQYEQAIVFNENVLASTSDDSYPLQIAALYNLGYAHTRLGQHQQAIEIYEQALALAEQPEIEGRLDWQGIILADLGGVYIALGEYEKAINLLQQSLPLIRQVIHEEIANSPYFDLDSFQAGRSITQRVILRHWQGSLLADLGIAYGKLGQHSKAIGFLEEALVIADEIGDIATESQVSRSLGNIHQSLGRNQQALAHYRKALINAERAGLRAEEGKIFSDIGKLLAQQNNLELAIVFLKSSVEVRESIRGDIRELDTDLQQSFTDTIADDYRFLADLLLQNNRILEAQRVLDLLKVQELDESLRSVDGNSDTETGVGFWQVEEDLLALYEQVTAESAELAELQAQDYDSLSPDQQQRLDELNQRYETVQNQFITFLDRPEVQELLDQIADETDRQNVDIERQHRKLQNQLRTLP